MRTQTGRCAARSQPSRVHPAGDEMEKHAVILMQAGVAVNRPADPCGCFDHWTSVTVHHSVPNCRVTTRQAIYQSGFRSEKQHLSAADLNGCSGSPQHMWHVFSHASCCCWGNYNAISLITSQSINQPFWWQIIIIIYKTEECRLL